MNRTLNELRPGESATVRGLSPDGSRNIARRLMDIGLTGGARVKYLFSAPSGEPRAYMISGARSSRFASRTRRWSARIRNRRDRYEAFSAR